MSNDKVKLGSTTAKNGFKNEEFVVDTFNKWKTNSLAQEWLTVMGYDIDLIENIVATKISGSHKSDVQVQVSVIIKLKIEVDYQNLQVKLVSNKSGFNQIDKRWLAKYLELWSIPDNVYKILQYYVGELKPYKANVRDKKQRRMFADEFAEEEIDLVLKFLNDNKMLIISDILKGRGQFSAEWMLVVRKTDITDWVLKPMNVVMQHFGSGDVVVTKLGNFKIGKVTMQRKGGDNGRETANMLQFKIDPTELFNI